MNSEHTMSVKKAPRIPLPKSWPKHARSAMLHVISLAQYATVYTRSWAVDSMNGRVRLKAENDRQQQEIAQLREEIRVKDARMAQISPHRRPHYPPTERMAILELRAARGWSLEQTANTFLLTAPTVASWMKRLDEEGPDALVQLREPVNKFPDLFGMQSSGSRRCVPTWARSKSPRHSVGPDFILDRQPSDASCKNHRSPSHRRPPSPLTAW